MTDQNSESPESGPEWVGTEGEMGGYCLRCGVNKVDHPETCDPVVGVLTGQVPVRSMPIAGVRGQDLPKQPLDGEVLGAIEGNRVVAMEDLDDDES